MSLRGLLRVSGRLLAASQRAAPGSVGRHAPSSRAPAVLTQGEPWLQCTPRRPLSTLEDVQDQVDSINELFVEARDLIEDARDEADTVYFNQSHQDAKAAVEDVLQRFRGVLDSLSEDERGKLQRSMGLKIEQLRAELEELDHLHA